MAEKTPPDPEETLMEFPCAFTIKTMGLACNDFEFIAYEIVLRHTPELERKKSIKTKLSKSGKYISVSITMTAESKSHMDAIYQDLTDCEHVLMSL
ncbi:MAG: transcriptional regulator [Cycloclasticus sp. symbiont of Poecilosclerida sp. M]|nr:MAG: transcriptional regulator [Cycloclasticus sp. symbiont of Poecilosclerida sp. M]